MSKEAIQKLMDESGLTEKEAEAILSEDDEDQEEEDFSDYGTDDDDEPGEEEPGDDEPGDDEPGEEEAPGDDEPGDDDDSGKDDEPEHQATDIRVPRLPDVPDVTKLKQGVDAISAEIKDLRAKWDEGELEDEEYHDQLDALNERKLDAKLAVRDAENAIKRNEERVEDQWAAAQDLFFEQPENKVFINNALLWTAMQTEVQRLSADEKFDGNYTKMLRQAREAVVKSAADLVGKPADEDAAGKGKDKDKRAAKPGNTAQDRAQRKREENANRDRPRTLRKSGEDPGLDDGEFSHLDGLKGRRLEMALSRLSQDQVDRYLMSSE